MGRLRFSDFDTPFPVRLGPDASEAFSNGFVPLVFDAEFSHLLPGGFTCKSRNGSVNLVTLFLHKVLLRCIGNIHSLCFHFCSDLLVGSGAFVEIQQKHSADNAQREESKNDFCELVHPSNAITASLCRSLGGKTQI